MSGDTGADIELDGRATTATYLVRHLYKVAVDWVEEYRAERSPVRCDDGAARLPRAAPYDPDSPREMLWTTVLGEEPIQ